MQEELNQKQKELDEKQKEFDQKQKELDQKQKELDEIKHKHTGFPLVKDAFAKWGEKLEQCTEKGKWKLSLYPSHDAPRTNLQMKHAMKSLGVYIDSPTKYYQEWYGSSPSTIAKSNDPSLLFPPDDGSAQILLYFGVKFSIDKKSQESRPFSQYPTIHPSEVIPDDFDPLSLEIDAMNMRIPEDPLYRKLADIEEEITKLEQKKKQLMWQKEEVQTKLSRPPKKMTRYPFAPYRRQEPIHE